MRFDRAIAWAIVIGGTIVSAQFFVGPTGAQPTPERIGKLETRVNAAELDLVRLATRLERIPIIEQAISDMRQKQDDARSREDKRDGISVAIMAAISGGYLWKNRTKR